MPTCWRMVPNTSLLARGLALAATLTGFVKSRLVTARTAEPLLVAFMPSTSLPLPAAIARHIPNKREEAKRQRKRGAGVARKRQVQAGSRSQFESADDLLIYTPLVATLGDFDSLRSLPLVKAQFDPSAAAWPALLS